MQSLLPMIQVAVQESIPQSMTEEERQIVDNIMEETVLVAGETFPADVYFKLAAESYTKIFTLAELKACLAFYQSPEGQSMITRQSLVFQDLISRSQPLLMDHMGEVVAVMEKKLK